MGTLEQLKAQKSRRKVVFVVWLGALAALMSFFLFIRSPYFSLGSIEVIENKYVPVEDVLKIANIPTQINVFRLDTQEIRTRLLNDLRISEAEVNRKFPATVEIRIKERQPVAIATSEYGFIEVDKKRIVLAVYKNLKQIEVPLITGFELGNVHVGDEIDENVFRNSIIYLSHLNEPALSQLSEINISNPEELFAYTANSIYIRIGKQERLAEKAKLTIDILHEITSKKLNIDYIEYVDLTFTAPVIKMKEHKNKTE